MHPRKSYLLGLLAGTGFGLAVAMIFVEPYWITPDNIRVRGGVALGGLVVAVLVENVFRWVQRRHEQNK